MKDFFPTALQIAAQYDPRLKATLERRQKQAEAAASEDRLHCIEVTLDDVIRFGEEENEHTLDLYRSVNGRVMELAREVRELKRFVSDTDAQLHRLYLDQQALICELQSRLAAWIYDKAG